MPVCALQLQDWPPSFTKKFEHNVYPIAFSVGNAQEWKKLFKPCAAQRLFLPVRYPDSHKWEEPKNLAVQPKAQLHPSKLCESGVLAFECFD